MFYYLTDASGTVFDTWSGPRRLDLYEPIMTTRGMLDVLSIDGQYVTMGKVETPF